jgi:perosamine synthetase
MGCAQMEKLPKLLKQKRALAERYAAAFKGIEGLRFLEQPEGCHSNYWLNTLVLDEASVVQRDDLLEATNSQNIMTRPVWTPLHQLPMFTDCPRMSLEVTEAVAKRIVNIPSTAGL